MKFSEKNQVFVGCMPALMTPCDKNGKINYTALVKTGRSLVDAGMSAVVYCGSMGDWPLLSLQQRKEGVEALVKEGLPVVVGTGAPSTAEAIDLAAHAQSVGAVGLMLIPRLLSRATIVSAQYKHFSSILGVAETLQSVIYNSPYYGYETKADLFFELREKHSNLVGFKEFGGKKALTYASENITSADSSLSLMIGVDTQVVHGFARCGAKGAITGVGNALPREILYFAELSKRAGAGDPIAFTYAMELNEALSVLSTFDEQPDLVLYYKHLMVLEGHSEYQYHINHDDTLTASQQAFLEREWKRFRNWWSKWQGKSYLSSKP